MYHSLSEKLEPMEIQTPLGFIKSQGGLNIYRLLYNKNKNQLFLKEMYVVQLIHITIYILQKNKIKNISR